LVTASSLLAVSGLLRLAFGGEHLFLAIADAAANKQHFGPLLPFFILNDEPLIDLIVYWSSTLTRKLRLFLFKTKP